MAGLLNPLNSEVWNCGHAFNSPCPLQWSNLDLTEQSGVRYCNVCEQQVYLCKTPEDFVERGNAGQCVAILDRFVPGVLTRHIMGQPSPEAVSKLEKRRVACRDWWKKVIAADVHFEPEALDGVSSTIETLERIEKP